ncbi:hypothetical protein ACFE04_014704 [Oxalis oulophora]
MADLVDGADTDFLTDQDKDNDSACSSDSEIYKYCAMNANKNRLFGREKPLHVVLGGGKPADIVLWRNKQSSACIFAGATDFFFGPIVHPFSICKSPPDFPKITLPEDMFLMGAASLRAEFNRASRTVREIALGNNLKQFLSVITGLWVLSIVGSWFDFLTLCYLVFVLALTMPALYEKNEDTVDEIAGKALEELKKQYTVLDHKFLRKLPSFTHSKNH